MAKRRRVGPAGRLARRRRTRMYRAAMAIAAGVLLVLALAYGFTRLGEDTPPARYPMAYTDLICARAAEEGLEPAYVASVILAESGYDPEAVSSADARGLMQILPSTAKWIAGKFGEEYVEGCLFDPATNVKYGCWYLGFLMDRYGGDMRASSAAYHAGQGTVDKWLKDPAYSPDGKTLAVIAYDSTNTYVNRILKYYEEYEKLYAEYEGA